MGLLETLPLTNDQILQVIDTDNFILSEKEAHKKDMTQQLKHTIN